MAILFITRGVLNRRLDFKFALRKQVGIEQLHHFDSDQNSIYHTIKELFLYLANVFNTANLRLFIFTDKLNQYIIR